APAAAARRERPTRIPPENAAATAAPTKSAHAKHHIDDQLVETLIEVTAPNQRVKPINLHLQRRKKISTDQKLPQLTNQLLHQHPIGHHAAGDEVPHADGVLVAVGVRVEVQQAVITGTLEQPHEQKRLLEVLGAKTKVLIVAPDPLRVKVDIKELADPQH